jgi:hypothetical protein
MIDHFSLVLGHGLLALAMLRLVMRDNLDVDPTLKRLKDKAQAAREAGSLSARRARRRAGGGAAAPEGTGESTD